MNFSPSLQTKIDEIMIRKCMELAKKALQVGDAPFGSVIAKDRKVFSCAYNKVRVLGDVGSHAEILAMKKA